MAWKRIDDRIRNNGNGVCGGDTAMVRRTYGLDGELWPRLTIAIHRDMIHLLPNREPGFAVGCSIKLKSGGWWDSVGIPCDLLDDVAEMLKEAKQHRDLMLKEPSWMSQKWVI